ncbi:TPA: hypothetical protein ACW0P3_004287 [Citrobacter freundii]
MSLKLFLVILLLTLVCFLIGLYAGGWAWYSMTGYRQGTPGLFTLLSQGEISLTDKGKVMLPWAWCVTAVITFLPTGITLFSYLARTDNSQNNLHGNARFANRRELRKIWYTESEK